MKKMPVILDVDTGLDDAFALALGLRCPSLEILAVATVGGNVSVDQSTRNTLDWLHFLGSDATPVGRGLDGLLPYSGDIHGKNGLGDVTLPTSPRHVEALPAPSLLVETARKHPNLVTLIATGPLTNLAEAIQLDSEAMKGFKRIIMMGGAVRLPGAAATGNVQPNVEFNFGSHPEAAQAVFRWAEEEGKQLEMIGLNTTEQIRMTSDDVDLLGKIGGELGERLVQMLQPIMSFYEETKRGRVFVPHDALAVMRAIRLDLFRMVDGHVEVMPSGQTILSPEGKQNASVAQSVDSTQLVQHMMETLLPGRGEEFTEHWLAK